MTSTQTKVVTRTFTASQPILNDRRGSDGEEWDVYAFVQGIKFRATGDPPFEFNLATETWRLLGKPRAVRLHIEPVE